MSVRSSPHAGASRFFRAVMPLVVGLAALAPSAISTQVRAVAPELPRAVPRVAQAASGPLKLRVINTGNVGAPIPAYQYIINVDDAGDTRQPEAECFPTYAGGTNANYPDGCNWPSIHNMVPGTSPGLVTQGDETVLNTMQSITLPEGKYVLTVIADDHKVDGAHFTIPLDDPSGILQVTMHPYPLPLGTVGVRVFNDNASVNGELDIPTEQGLAGFVGHISDVMGEVTTDWFGNPLCTQYVPDGFGKPDPEQPIPGTGGQCLSDANGDLFIPNLGPNRYAVQVIPPNGTDWIRTTTLEGGEDWDDWIQEGTTGFESEVIVGGEPIPEIPAGFVRPTSRAGAPTAPTNGTAANTGKITGRLWSAKTYLPPVGGLAVQGTNGAKLDKIIPDGWVALTDLRAGDSTVYVGQANSSGFFTITNVPNGDYSLTMWDKKQNQLLDFLQVTVAGGLVVNVGDIPLAHWFGIVEGTVFVDTNENGKKDVGESGIPNFAIAFKQRDNTSADAGQNASITNNAGFYQLRRVYPYGQHNVVEAYNDRFYTTGFTYQADNQPTETTILGAGVDVKMFVNFGLTTRLDWGVKPYKANTNGGIVGTVSYDVTRNELDPRLSATEPYQPGIPGLTMKLYSAVKDVNGIALTDTTPGPNFGAYLKASLLNTYTTESFARITGCAARDMNGVPYQTPWMPNAGDGKDCIEGIGMSNQVDSEFAEVAGNFGFGDVAYNPDGSVIPEEDRLPLVPGDYLLEVEIPTDPITNKPLWQVTREEDLNVFKGDQFVPQIPPPACAGPLHVVDVAGIAPDGPNAVYNPTFVEGGGSPYEGQLKPLCTTKLVNLQNQRSIAPIFQLFTQVPLPTRFFGFLIDDLALSVNPKEILYGDRSPIPNAPIGIYDYSGKLIYTAESDVNGIFEVILPSTDTYNCPLPAGPCPNVYRFIANDPGTPEHPNLNYNRAYRTIAANFQAWPGLNLPADLAPTKTSVTVLAPGSQLVHPPTCPVDTGRPQLFAVDKPYANMAASAVNFTIKGLDFGATQGTGSVKLGNTTLATVSWADRQIVATIPANMVSGAYALKVTAANGLSTWNGLTFHVLRSGAGQYNPTVYEVGPGKTYATVQAALNAANNNANALVVVYPNTPGAFNPKGGYYENIVINSPVKLQGVGPGGDYPGNTVEKGSILDGLGFTTQTGRPQAWRALVNTLTWSGNPNIYEGEVVYVTARNNGSQWTATNPARIDGFTIQGGDQLEFPTNIDPNTGLPVTGAAGNDLVVQGGGIFVNAYARNLQITNNILQSNGGTYGGAVRVGTEDIGSNNNDNIRIANNRILANGGSFRAGGIGLFNGSNGYEIDRNDMCGNYSAEYGGAISHYGLSPGGKIHDNRIYFNGSYDEGGGVFIGGQLPPTTTVLSQGTGNVDIYNNLIQSNLGNDDGGGIRLLSVNTYTVNIYNNMIVNNVSTHEGGGIALDDAPNARIYNNTIMKNLTTATANTSNGAPAPAGLSDTGNSLLLQARLPSGHAQFSDPINFNNIFWDNLAGYWDGTAVRGIGLSGDATPLNYWDLGVADGLGLLHPTTSLLKTTSGTSASATNQVNINPDVVSSYNTVLDTLAFRGNLAFRQSLIVTVDLPPVLLGNYHLRSTSPAIDTGAASASGVSAPALDFDNLVRPAGSGFDKGAHEYGAVAPVPQTPFPSTGILDNFNRANGGLGTNWVGNTATSLFRINSNFADPQGAGGTIFWNPSTFGAEQEAYFSWSNVLLSLGTTQGGVLLKVNNLNGSNLFQNGSSAIRVNYFGIGSNGLLGGRIEVSTLAPGQGSPAGVGWVLRGTIANANSALQSGDQLGVRVLANGTVAVYKIGFSNVTPIGTVSLTIGATPWPPALVAGGGKIGAWFSRTGAFLGINFGSPPLNISDDGHFDNFGGGTFVPATLAPEVDVTAADPVDISPDVAAPRIMYLPLVTRGGAE